MMEFSNLDAFYTKPVEVSFGRFANEMNFQNSAEGLTLYELLSAQFAFRVGPKDGRCIVGSHTTTGRRTAQHMSGPTILMIDHDTGETMDEIAAKYESAGLYALLWNTFSHLKAQSDVTEKALSQYLKKAPKWKSQGQTAPDLIDEEVLTEQIRDYFVEEKGYIASLAETMHSPVRTTSDGVRYVISHDPMHKLRSLLVLEEKFDLLNSGVQDERITEWKERYAGFCQRFNVPYDNKCVDPCRLMYLPVRPKGSDESNYEIREVEGRYVTLDDMPRFNKRTGKVEVNAFTDAARELRASIGDDNKDTRKFETRNLRKFMAQGGSSFAIAEWLREVAQDDVRAERDLKLTLCCPNDDNHTNAGDPNDQGFWVQNAQDRDEGAGFMAMCSHTTCGSMSNNDRAWYLDALCQKYGVEDALDLKDWCDDWKESNDEIREAEASENEKAWKTGLSALPAAPSPDDLLVLVRIIAAGPNGLYEDARLDAIVEKVGKSRARRATLVKEIRKERDRLAVESARAANGGGNSAAPPGEVIDQHPVPSDPSKATVIWDTWGHSDRRRVAIAVFEKKNFDDPTVFVDAEGKYVRVRKRGNSTYLEVIDSSSAWSSILSDHMTFKCAETERSGEREVKPFDDVVIYIHGSRAVDVPVLKRVINVPVFGADGELRTEEGYCPSAGCWLDPALPFREVPEVVTQEHIEEAAYWFWEAFIDFPFSDVFDGSKDLPVKSGEKDQDDHELPTYARGLSSRTHAVSMCLSPFVRSMMTDGKAPAFLIDKSEPGTGAGYLADVLGYMLYGTPMPPKDLPLSEEEVSKVLLAGLVRGKPTLFLDNINHDVDSASLAAALTASNIEGRILGTSTYIDVPVEWTMILAANNGKLTSELMRRVIPIRLDAALPNPAASRPPSFYKYVLHDFLAEHRADLVWAAHVMVKWWLQNGSPDATHGRRLQSFNSWSKVVGGVLELAGVEGFLASLESFNAARNDDRGTEILLMERIISRYPVGEPFTSSDAYQCTLPLMGGDRPDPSLGLNLGGRDEAGMTISLGKLLSKSVGKTFDLPKGRVKLARKEVRKSYQYMFDDAEITVAIAAE